MFEQVSFDCRWSYSSNTDQGYVLRRLIRRAIRFADIMKIEAGKISELVSVVPTIYGSAYTNLAPQIEKITQVIAEEEQKFRKLL